MTHLFDTVHIIATYGYLGIFLIVFFESGIFFLLPADSLLFTGGIVAAAGGFNLYLLLFLVLLSTYLGGIAGYEIGTKLEKLERFTLFKKLFNKEHIEKTQEFFNKYGRVSILFSRFVPIVRTFTPMVAGLAEVPYIFYLRYSLLGALIWSTSITLAGFFLGRAYPNLKDHITLIIILIVTVSILPIIFKAIQSRNKKI